MRAALRHSPGPRIPTRQNPMGGIFRRKARHMPEEAYFYTLQRNNISEITFFVNWNERHAPPHVFGGPRNRSEAHEAIRYGSLRSIEEPDVPIKVFCDRRCNHLADRTSTETRSVFSLFSKNYTNLRWALPVGYLNQPQLQVF